MKQLRQHAEANNISIADVVLANEIAVGGKNEDQIIAGRSKGAIYSRSPKGPSLSLAA